MLKGFVCPDGEKVTLDACLNGCRLGERCATRSFLKFLKEGEREWNGTSSVTQLINGTREAYLKIMNDYYIVPDKNVFRVFGSKSHENLEDDSIERGAWKGISGVPDEIVPYENGEGFEIIDHKFIGSYKVGLLLGMTKERVPDGRYKNGKEKWKTLIHFDPDAKDDFDYRMQLNYYRLIVENCGGFKVNKLTLACYPRDGGTRSAFGNGINKNIYIINIPIMDEEEIERYFLKKRDNLLDALVQESLPEICNSHENWHGRKCEQCEVREYCEGNPFVGKEE